MCEFMEIPTVTMHDELVLIDRVGVGDHEDEVNDKSILVKPTRPYKPPLFTIS